MKDIHISVFRQCSGTHGRKCVTRSASQQSKRVAFTQTNRRQKEEAWNILIYTFFN